MNPRLFLIPPAFVIIAAIAFIPTHSSATQSATIWAWCMSDSNPTYFGGPFDSGMTAKSPTFNGLSLARQFTEYLKGRYDIKGDASLCT